MHCMPHAECHVPFGAMHYLSCTACFVLLSLYHLPCAICYALFAMLYLPCTVLQKYSAAIVASKQVVHLALSSRKSQYSFAVISFMKRKLKTNLDKGSLLSNPSNTGSLASYQLLATLWLTLFQIKHLPINLAFLSGLL